METNKKRFFNLNEAAAYLGMSAPTLRRAVEKGLIPCKRIGARYFFFKEALDAWGMGK